MASNIGNYNKTITQEEIEKSVKDLQSPKKPSQGKFCQLNFKNDMYVLSNLS